MKDIDFNKLLSHVLDEMNEKQPHDLQEELDIVFRLFENEFKNWKRRFIKNIFSLDFIISKISKRECLLCKTNLDADIGKGKWHIPLCKTHRLREMKQIIKQKAGGLVE